MSIMQNHQVNVLVVDSDVSARAQIQETLSADGYACQAVGTAAEAKRVAAEKAPDLLICDVNLDDATGFDLFDALKTYAGCAVLFTSGSRRPETMEHARAAGATYFLSKPIDPTVLLELVDKALWMPHLVQRHVDSSGHQLKAPTFAPAAARTARS